MGTAETLQSILGACARFELFPLDIAYLPRLTGNGVVFVVVFNRVTKVEAVAGESLFRIMAFRAPPSRVNFMLIVSMAAFCTTVRITSLFSREESLEVVCHTVFN